MEDPPQPTRADVVSSNVTGRGRLGLRRAETNNDEVLVDDPGRRQRHIVLGVVATQVFAQIDRTVRAEALDGVSCGFASGE
jgi:hypothetical protein